MKRNIVFITCLLCLITSFTRISKLNNDVDFVDLYSTYGYRDGDTWVVPVTVYVWEPRNYVQRSLLSLFQRFFNLTHEERAIFNSRVKTFIADSESREQVSLLFENDPNDDIITLADDFGRPLQTDRNGLIETTLRFDPSRIEELMRAQDSQDGWLALRIVSDGHQGSGKIRFVQAHGTSVITDIDDTVKISEMPAGSRIAIRNAFLKEYTVAPEMPELFQNWSDYPVHYVSGTPKQFYRPLKAFLFSDEIGYPKGSFHMRNVKKNLTTLATWNDLEDMFTQENVTFDHKLNEIATIFSHFPQRKFILVGDSGQYDPEIFREIDHLFPGQVERIFIRDTVNDRAHSPERLEGMTIIPAETVVHGRSQFQREDL